MSAPASRASASVPVHMRPKPRREVRAPRPRRRRGCRRRGAPTRSPRPSRRWCAGRVRTGSASRVPWSSGFRTTPTSAPTVPISTTWLTSAAPVLLEERLGNGAQRHPGCCLPGRRSEHRPCVGEAVLLHAGQVGVPGTNGSVARSAPAPPAARHRPGRPPAVSHFGHSALLPTRIATGPPWVSPWRTPPRICTSSCSNFIRAPRPCPSRRRRSASAMSVVVTWTPAGRPSRIDQRRPVRLPMVNQRNMSGSMRPRPRRRRAPRSARPPTCTGRTGSRSCVQPGRRR